MLRLILLLLLVILLSLGASWLLDNNGSLVLSWLGYEVYTSVAVLIAVVAALVLGTIFITQSLLWCIGMPLRMKHALYGNKHEKALKALTQGYIALSAGETKPATIAARKAEKLLGKEPLVMMLSAETAKLEGNHTLAKERFAAMLEHESAEMMGLKGLLAEARRENDIGTALDLAERAFAKHPEADGLVPVLLDLYKHEGRWEDALKLIEKGDKFDPLGKHKVLREIDFRQQRAELLLMQARKRIAEGKHEAAIGLLKKAQKVHPHFLPVMIASVEVYILAGNKRGAEKMLKQAWKEEAHPELAVLFRRLHEQEKPKAMLKKAQRLTAVNADRIESHKLVAREALAAEKFTVARNHLKLALGKRETVSVCRLMVKLEQQDPQGSQREVEKWKEKQDTAFVDAHWSCVSCQHSPKNWEVICPACHAVDTVGWDTTPRIHTMERQEQYDAPPPEKAAEKATKAADKSEVS
jgi:HemY protein